MKRVLWFVTAVAGAVGLAIVLSMAVTHAAEEDDGSDYTEVGDTAPAFSLSTLDGETVTNESAKGKVLVINFFATWCGPCRAELPHLEKAYEGWKENENILLVVAGREHSKEEVAEFQKTEDLDLPFAPDPGRAVYSKFAEQWIPRNYVIAPDGTIAFQSRGFDESEFKEMLATVDKLVDEIEAAG